MRVYEFKYVETHLGIDYAEYELQDKSNNKRRVIFGQNWNDEEGYFYGGYGLAGDW